MAMVPVSEDPSSPEDDLLIDVPPLEGPEADVDHDWVFLRSLSDETKFGTPAVDERLRAVVSNLLARLGNLPEDVQDKAREDLEGILKHLDSTQPERATFEQDDSAVKSIHASVQDASQSYRQALGDQTALDQGLLEIDSRLESLKKQKEELERLIAETEAERTERITAQQAAKQHQRSQLKELRGQLDKAKSARANSWRVLVSRATEIGELGLRLYRYKTRPAQLP